jgi:tRNA A37 threonylcarbamoyltransferase TsaD
MRLSLDNGAMIAAAGYMLYNNGTRSGIDLKVRPDLAV